ncbi:sulfur carrier protein ThiS [Thermodesulfobacteriota bacterium]
MIIKINDIETNFDGQTLLDLARLKNLEEKTGLAVAVNEKVVKRDEWARYHLKDSDSVIIIVPVQGG